MLVSLINHVLEEAKQKIKVVADRNNHGEASHREHEPKKSPQKEIDLSVDKDVMDCIPSSLDKFAQFIYFVTFSQSSQCIYCFTPIETTWNDC